MHGNVQNTRNGVDHISEKASGAVQADR
ncbi:uncharacterized protein METZ01_LOCUS198393 [marine metagenome]|uniref:Uncharacterized protein n=1 Tax=marine metagenome TaxID=408172 RepID=A0A382E543_9ZZZZ